WAGRGPTVPVWVAGDGLGGGRGVGPVRRGQRGERQPRDPGRGRGLGRRVDAARRLDARGGGQHRVPRHVDGPDDPRAPRRGRTPLVTGGLPAEAEEVLDRGVLCYLAVRPRFGPHLTPVVYVEDGGRLWVTTARSSAKARAW